MRRAEKMFGFVSPSYTRMARRGSHTRNVSVVYLTPSGEEVECNFIDRCPAGSHYKWDDMTCVGEVTKFVRAGEVNPNYSCHNTFTNLYYGVKLL